MSSPPVSPYPYSLDEPLLWLTRKNPWTIRMACEGTQILGDMGSGKTSGSGRTLAKAMLPAGFGGLVLCKKVDEYATWIDYAKETGRMDQLLIVDPSQPWRFNFLDYQFKRAGEGAGYVDNAVALFMNLIENRREGAQQTRGRNEAFWVDGARRLVRHTMEALLLAGEPVSMDNLKKAITTLPSANEETGERLWPKDKNGNATFLAQCLGKAVYRQQHGWDAGHLTTSTPDDIIEYYEAEFARPGAKPQASCQTTISCTRIRESAMRGFPPQTPGVLTICSVRGVLWVSWDDRCSISLSYRRSRQSHKTSLRCIYIFCTCENGVFDSNRRQL